MSPFSLKMSRLIALLSIPVLASLLLTLPALADGPGTAFSYQGSLRSGDSPVNDTCALTFKLYDDATGGAQLGDTQTAAGVAVSDGLLTTELDFGADVFTGPPRWLEISVQCSGDSTLTALSPRQPLRPTPYALYAAQAGSVAWSDVISKPTNLAVITQTISGLSCSDGQLAKWNGSTWACADDGGGVSYSAGTGIAIADGVISSTLTAGAGLTLTNDVISSTVPQPENIIWVAKSGGDFTGVQAALDSITDAADGNRYLVKVAPGVYTERVTMKPYVDIEGSGELTTKITYGASVSDFTGTVLGASNAELRFLTVANTGEGNYAVAIYNNAASPRLTHVTATASGPIYYSYGVYNSNSSPTMTNVTATASEGSQNYGVYNSNSSPTMTGVTATAADGAGYGVYNTDNSFPLIRNSALSGSYRSLTGTSAKVAASMLDGTVGYGNTCVGAYNGSYVALNTSCQ